MATRRRASSRRELAPGREAGILIRGRSPGPTLVRPGPGPAYATQIPNYDRKNFKDDSYPFFGRSSPLVPDLLRT